MLVFVTGATGFIGSAIVQNLIAGGHQVVGLARSDESAAKLAQAGARALRGELADLETLAAGARDSEGVIHTAFGHDFSQYAAALEADKLAVDTLVDALKGSNKPLVIASGTLMAAHASPATELDGPASPDGPRAGSEMAVLAAADHGVRGSVVRLAPCVHDQTHAGLATMMIDVAREKGFSAYVGEGATRWPGVHYLDAARLFCLALEKAKPGSRWHAAGEEGLSTKAIAEAIGERVGVPARSISAEEAPALFGFLAFALSTDNLTSSAITRETLGWSPKEVGLLEDLRNGG